jgi:hypothetical protein
MIARKQISLVILLMLALCSAGSCVSLSERQKREYGILESAVTFSADKVIGEYGDRIPDDFSAGKFMALVKDKIPKDYYEVLKKHSLEVRPKQSYYLLLLFDPDTKALILFDFSCTAKVDGPVLLEPGKYRLENIDAYDACKVN